MTKKPKKILYFLQQLFLLPRQPSILPYHHVLQCLISKPIYTSKIKSATPLHPKIEYSWRHNKYFNDCIGAVDGTHIPISPPHNKREPWRDRDGHLTQNVLAICNFDMEFTDLLCGWSGSTAVGFFGTSSRSRGRTPKRSLRRSFQFRRHDYPGRCV